VVRQQLKDCSDRWPSAPFLYAVSYIMGDAGPLSDLAPIPDSDPAQQVIPSFAIG
jgi:hypothetical protein